MSINQTVRRSEAPALAAEFVFRPDKDPSGSNRPHPTELVEGAQSFHQKRSRAAVNSVVLNAERDGARPRPVEARLVQPGMRQTAAADSHGQMAAATRASAVSQNSRQRVPARRQDGGEAGERRSPIADQQPRETCRENWRNSEPTN